MILCHGLTKEKKGEERERERERDRQTVRQTNRQTERHRHRDIVYFTKRLNCSHQHAP